MLTNKLTMSRTTLNNKNDSSGSLKSSSNNNKNNNNNIDHQGRVPHHNNNHQHHPQQQQPQRHQQQPVPLAKTPNQRLNEKFEPFGYPDEGFALWVKSNACARRTTSGVDVEDDGGDESSHQEKGTTRNNKNRNRKKKRQQQAELIESEVLEEVLNFVVLILMRASTNLYEGFICGAHESGVQFQLPWLSLHQREPQLIRNLVDYQSRVMNDIGVAIEILTEIYEQEARPFGHPENRSKDTKQLFGGFQNLLYSNPPKPPPGYPQQQNRRNGGGGGMLRSPSSAHSTNSTTSSAGSSGHGRFTWGTIGVGIGGGGNSGGSGNGGGSNGGNQSKGLLLTPNLGTTHSSFGANSNSNTATASTPSSPTSSTHSGHRSQQQHPPPVSSNYQSSGQQHRRRSSISESISIMTKLGKSIKKSIQSPGGVQSSNNQYYGNTYEPWTSPVPVNMGNTLNPHSYSSSNSNPNGYSTHHYQQHQPSTNSFFPASFQVMVNSLISPLTGNGSSPSSSYSSSFNPSSSSKQDEKQLLKEERWKVDILRRKASIRAWCCSRFMTLYEFSIAAAATMSISPASPVSPSGPASKRSTCSFGSFATSSFGTSSSSSCSLEKEFKDLYRIIGKILEMDRIAVELATSACPTSSSACFVSSSSGTFGASSGVPCGSLHDALVRQFEEEKSSERERPSQEDEVENGEDDDDQAGGGGFKLVYGHYKTAAPMKEEIAVANGEATKRFEKSYREIVLGLEEEEEAVVVEKEKEMVAVDDSTPLGQKRGASAVAVVVKPTDNNKVVVDSKGKADVTKKTEKAVHKPSGTTVLEDTIKKNDRTIESPTNVASQVQQETNAATMESGVDTSFSATASSIIAQFNRRNSVSTGSTGSGTSSSSLSCSSSASSLNPRMNRRTGKILATHFGNHFNNGPQGNSNEVTPSIRTSFPGSPTGSVSSPTSASSPSSIGSAGSTMNNNKIPAVKVNMIQATPPTSPLSQSDPSTVTGAAPPKGLSFPSRSTISASSTTSTITAPSCATTNTSTSTHAPSSPSPYTHDMYEHYRLQDHPIWEPLLDRLTKFDSTHHSLDPRNIFQFFRRMHIHHERIEYMTEAYQEELLTVLWVLERCAKERKDFRQSPTWFRMSSGASAVQRIVDQGGLMEYLRGLREEALLLAEGQQQRQQQRQQDRDGSEGGHDADEEQGEVEEGEDRKGKGKGKVGFMDPIHLVNPVTLTGYFKRLLKESGGLLLKETTGLFVELARPVTDNGDFWNLESLTRIDRALLYRVLYVDPARGQLFLRISRLMKTILETSPPELELDAFALTKMVQVVELSGVLDLKGLKKWNGAWSAIILGYM